MRTRSGVLAVALPLAAALLASACSSSLLIERGGRELAAAAASTAKITAIGAENEYADVIAQVGGKYVNVVVDHEQPEHRPAHVRGQPGRRQGGHRAPS